MTTVIKVVVDKIPENCKGCPIRWLNTLNVNYCGKRLIGSYFEPDERCLCKVESEANNG